MYQVVPETTENTYVQRLKWKKSLDIGKEKKDYISINKNTKKNVLHFSPTQSEKSYHQFLQLV